MSSAQKEKDTTKLVVLRMPYTKGYLTSKQKMGLTLLEKSGMFEEWFFLNGVLEIRTRVENIIELNPHGDVESEIQTKS